MSEVNKKKLIRNIVAVLGGMLLAAIVAYLVEGIGHSIWPPPELPDGTTPEQATAAAAAWMKIAPIGAMLMVALAHLVGVAVGVWFAFKMQKGFKLAGMIVGVIFLLMALATWAMITHPFWFMVVDFVAIVIGIVIPWRALKS